MSVGQRRFTPKHGGVCQHMTLSHLSSLGKVTEEVSLLVSVLRNCFQVSQINAAVHQLLA
jgi:hypothetical protein